MLFSEHRLAEATGIQCCHWTRQTEISLSQYKNVHLYTSGCVTFGGHTEFMLAATICTGEIIFPLTSLSRPALGHTQSPVQWVPGVKSGRGVTLPTHPT
jgi:hypothetical protein